MSRPGRPAPMLTLAHISKTFGRGTGAVHALRDVSLAIPPGAATALLGENGAGKSTLMNVLVGLVQPDAGQVLLDGQPVRITGPKQARQLGIGMVHQHFKLVEPLSVAENVALALGDLPFVVNRRRLATRIADAARTYRLDLAPDTPIEQLSVGQRQRVEILKALVQEVRYLVLDEPTAVLTPQEADELFTIVRRLCAGGVGVVFITHRLAEVTQICSAVTVLRRGAVTHAGPVDAAVTPARLADWMVGADDASVVMAEPRARAAAPAAPPTTLLSVENLTVPAAGPARRGRRPLVDRVSFELRTGEILGVAGVDGNGQRELCEALCGLRAAEGVVRYRGEDISRWPAGRRFAAGLAHIADDRQREGLVLPLSVAANLALKAHATPACSRWGWLRLRRWRDRAAQAIAAYRIKAPGPRVAVGELSGGNQQKVILAREIGLDPSAADARRVVIAMNPARGLDVSATRFVYEQLAALRDRGAAILLVAADLDDLLAWSDRLAVLFAGRLTLTDWPGLSRAAIGELMLGHGPAAGTHSAA